MAWLYKVLRLYCCTQIELDMPGPLESGGDSPDNIQCLSVGRSDRVTLGEEHESISPGISVELEFVGRQAIAVRCDERRNLHVVGFASALSRHPLQLGSVTFERLGLADHRAPTVIGAQHSFPPLGPVGTEQNRGSRFLHW